MIGDRLLEPAASAGPNESGEIVDSSKRESVTIVTRVAKKAGNPWRIFLELAVNLLILH
jgi:hypothetical protein